MDKRKPPTDTALTQAMKSDEKKLSIIIHGIPGKEDENMEKTVTNILKEADCDFGWTVVTKAFRLGKKMKKETTPKKTTDNNEQTSDKNKDKETTDTHTQNTKKIISRPRSIKIQLEKESHKKELFQKRNMLQSKENYSKVIMRPVRSEAEMLNEGKRYNKFTHLQWRIKMKKLSQ